MAVLYVTLLEAHTLRMRYPIQNHALRLCLGAYRTSSSSSRTVLANEPSRYVRLSRLSIQYSLKLSSAPQNPYNDVFAFKLKYAFDCKATQIPPRHSVGLVGLLPVLHAISFKQKHTLQSSISVIPP